MAKNGVRFAAVLLASSSVMAAGAARSCSLERQETGFNAYLPLGESKLGLSCTSWIGSSGICYAGDLSFGDRSIELRGSAKHGNAFIGVPMPLSGKRLEVDADSKSKSSPLAVKMERQ